MTSSNMWQQGLDFETTDLGHVTPERFLSCFDERPWRELRAQWAGLAADSDGACPPCIGATLADETCIHVFVQSPQGDAFGAVISVEMPTKILGFIPSKKTLRHAPVDMSPEQARDLLASVLRMTSKERLEFIKASQR